jgi:Ca2+:H+ antiporter
VRRILRAVFDNRLNLLLAMVPVSWALWWMGVDSIWLFAVTAMSIVPLASLIGLGTEELAKQTGPALGGFLNATFGNAAELIIAFVALRAQHVALLKASITGSIIGNLLLVLGASMFVGGLGRTSQTFNRTAAGNQVVMLFLAVVSLVMPAVVDLTVFGSLTAHPAFLDTFSFAVAIVLIVAYLASLVFAFKTNRDVFRPVEDKPRKTHLAIWQSMVVLAIGTALTAVQAELLIARLEPALKQLGLTELFVGVILIAIIGNAAEHYSALVAARDDQMTLAVEIAVGSSAQIALLVAPVLVLASFALGHPMTLVFNSFELTAIALSVIATALVVADGESNWVEGLQLLAVYLVVALAFYFIPPGH